MLERLRLGAGCPVAWSAIVFFRKVVQTSQGGERENRIGICRDQYPGRVSVFRPILAEAAEIKLLCAVAMKPAVDELAPGFERSTGHKVIITYATAGVLRDKIRSAEPFDAVVLPTPFMDPLVTQGTVASGSVVVLARSLVSVGVRAGAPKPDISTVAAFKNAMLAAKSISYADPSQGGGSGI